MAKHHLHNVNHPLNAPPKEGDIATEKYKGPGKVITSAGYMYISHAAAMIVGLLGLGAMGAIFHTRTNAIKQWAESLSTSHADSNGIKKAAASTIAWVSNMAEKAAHKIIGVGKKLAGKRLNGKTLGEEKTAAFLFSGGFGAIFGYAGSSIWGILKGAHEGDRGKRQFERAQEEIKHLREVNEDLEKINDRMHQEVVDEATKFKDAAPDQQEQKAHAAHTSHTPEHKAHAAQHEAKKEHASAAHHADKPHTQTHAHAHEGTVGHHAHEPAVA